MGGSDTLREDLEAFGLQLEKPIEPEGTDVWPDNWLAVQSFAALSTQWRLGPSGQLVGLDYGAIPPTLDLLGIKRAEWPDVFAGLRVMEAEAINEAGKRG